MGNATIARENVGYIDALVAHGFEPVGLGVILARQIIRTDIGRVRSVCVEYAQVEKRLGSRLKIAQEHRRPRGVAQIVEAVGLRGEEQIGGSFVEELIDEPPVIGDDAPQSLLGPPARIGNEIVSQDPAHQRQRDQWHKQHAQEDHAPDLFKTRIFHRWPPSGLFIQFPDFAQDRLRRTVQ